MVRVSHLALGYGHCSYINVYALKKIALKDCGRKTEAPFAVSFSRFLLFYTNFPSLLD